MVFQSSQQNPRLQELIQPLVFQPALLVHLKVAESSLQKTMEQHQACLQRERERRERSTKDIIADKSSSSACKLCCLRRNFIKKVDGIFIRGFGQNFRHS